MLLDELLFLVLIGFVFVGVIFVELVQGRIFLLKRL